MSKTGEHLRAAMAALANVTDDEGGSSGIGITVHRTTAAVDFVATLPGARRTTEHTGRGLDGSLDRYDVVRANVDGVEITAFGVHEKMRMVPA